LASWACEALSVVRIGCALRPQGGPSSSEAWEAPASMIGRRGRELGECLVGLPGLEPGTSSLSAKCGEPLCQRPYPQVTLNRTRRSYVLSSRPVMCSLHASIENDPPVGPALHQISKHLLLARGKARCASRSSSWRSSTSPNSHGRLVGLPQDGGTPVAADRAAGGIACQLGQVARRPGSRVMAQPSAQRTAPSG
jgi:hypothetical protein